MNYRHTLILFFHFTLGSGSLFSQVSPSAADAGIAHASVAKIDRYAAFSNPAGLADEKGFGAGITARNQYNISELSVSGITANQEIKNAGVFHLTLIHSGIRNFMENQFSFGFSKRLHPKLAAGITGRYTLTTIPEHPEGERRLVTGEAGVIAEPVNRIFIGMKIFNPNRPGYSSYTHERWNSGMEIGMGWKPSGKLWLGFQAHKIIDQPANLSFGIEYHPVATVCLRAGQAGSPLQTTFGVGLHWKHFVFDTSVESHQVLGISSGCSIFFKPGDL